MGRQKRLLDYTYLAFYKPKDVVCALKDNLHKTIMEFLPPQYQNLKIVGRLDKDTTGLILLTDDGQFIHQMTHPKKHIPKIYQVTLLKDFQEGNREILENPMFLDYGKTLIRGGKIEIINPRVINLMITEGKFHQVKKMIFNIDNEVVDLKRIAIGNLELRNLNILEKQYTKINKNDV